MNYADDENKNIKEKITDIRNINVRIIDTYAGINTDQEPIIPLRTATTLKASLYAWFNESMLISKFDKVIFSRNKLYFLYTHFNSLLKDEDAQGISPSHLSVVQDTIATMLSNLYAVINASREIYKTSFGMPDEEQKRDEL